MGHTGWRCGTLGCGTGRLCRDGAAGAVLRWNGGRGRRSSTGVLAARRPCPPLVTLLVPNSSVGPRVVVRACGPVLVQARPVQAFPGPQTVVSSLCSKAGAAVSELPACHLDAVEDTAAGAAAAVVKEQPRTNPMVAVPQAHHGRRDAAAGGAAGALCRRVSLPGSSRASRPAGKAIWRCCRSLCCSAQQPQWPGCNPPAAVSAGCAGRPPHRACLKNMQLALPTLQAAC